MEQLAYNKSYKEYKAELDAELTKTAEGFVRIGYLLKVARDTDILKESGYGNVVDFARAEYDIDKTQVSRFIHINDKFSEGGYSDHLLPGYQGFGYAKLSLMLLLPDAVNEALSPSYSKAEIQAIRDEVDAESRISDIEVMLEGSGETKNSGDHEIGKAVRQLGEDMPELFVQMHKIFRDPDWTVEDIKETMAPQGEKTYSIRIRGTGRLMLMLNAEADIQVVNIRSGEKTAYGWGDISVSWQQLLNPEKTAEEDWSELYGREFPKVAPVQPEKHKEPVKKKPAPKKEIKVAKAKTEWRSIYKVGQKVTILSNGDTGTLAKKKPAPGIWSVNVQGHMTDMKEAEFGEYMEPENLTLHDVEVTIPVPDPKPVMNEPQEAEKLKAEKSKEEEQLPGQAEITDYPECLPAETLREDKNIIDAPVAEKITQEQDNKAGKKDEQQDQAKKVILGQIDNLKRHVIEGAWKMAAMDAEMIMDSIERVKNITDLVRGD